MRSRSCCVVSECEWRSNDPPTRVVDFWREGYPAMGDRESNLRRATESGYRVIGTRVMSDEGWNRNYGSIAAAIRDGRAASPDAAVAERLLEEQEIYQLGKGSFGCVFYILQAW